MLGVFMVLAGVYWLLISALAIQINLKTFKKLSGYGDIPSQKPEWEGIMRKDFQKWKKNRIMLGCITILPLKFFALANFLIGALSFAAVMGWLKQGPLKQKVIKACMLYFNYYGRLMNNLAITITDNCPNAEDRKIRTPIIIANHSNWFDIFYICLKYSPVSFVAKYQIQYWPVIGPLSKAIGCIFVKRTNEDDRNSAKSLIKKRVDDFANNVSSAFPLAVFPQGTTSNNRVILNFKSGAFDNLSPLTMICLKYECEDFMMGQDELEQSQHIFLMLAQRNSLTATKIQMEPLDFQNPQQYMERCRQKMAETLGFPKVNAGYRDRLQVENIRKRGMKVV